MLYPWFSICNNSHVIYNLLYLDKALVNASFLARIIEPFIDSLPLFPKICDTFFLWYNVSHMNKSLSSNSKPEDW